MIVDLLRHGETEQNGFCGSTDSTLTARGWTQMRSALEDARPWQAIVSSPLLRCADFAREYADRHKIPLRIDKRLREIHFGQWEGQSPAELMKKQPQDLALFWTNPYDNPPPGGETLVTFEKRVLEAWQTIRHMNLDQRILIVTHGGVIRMLLCHSQKLPRTHLLQLEVLHASLHSIPTLAIPITSRIQ
ncbi:MAG: alpha-ribazole phosphatase family protein [Methylococcales bacterium]